MGITNHTNKVGRVFEIVKDWPHLTDIVSTMYRKSMADPSMTPWDNQTFLWPHDVSVIPVEFGDGRSRLYQMVHWAFVRRNQRKIFLLGGAIQPVEQVFSMTIFNVTGIPSTFGLGGPNGKKGPDIQVLMEYSHWKGGFEPVHLHQWYDQFCTQAQLVRADSSGSMPPLRHVKAFLEGLRDEPTSSTTGVL